MKLTTTAAAVFGCIASVQARLGDKFRHLQDDDMVDVIVQFKNPVGESHITNKATKVNKKLHRAHALAASVRKKELKDLKNDPDIKLVVFDEMLHQDGANSGGFKPLKKTKEKSKGEGSEKEVLESGETTTPEAINSMELTPWGISAVQGEFAPKSAVKEVAAPPQGACSSEDAIRVAIIDSGIDYLHPDLCGGNNKNSDVCIGKSFVDDKKAKWNEPSDAHGTHIAGTIAASGKNGLGVQGMINDDNICLIVARVFANGISTSTSTILAAMEWVVDEGADIINLSLGGGQYNTLFYDEILDAHNSGAIVVASAGNDGDLVSTYPASYPHVLSVTALDPELNRAHFSNAARTVDLAAPGVAILSTSPDGLGTAAFMASVDGETSTFGQFMQYSAVPRAAEKAKLVSCGLALSKCEGVKGNFCLIERGSIRFSEKAAACEDGGGIGALIYNNLPGMFSGSLGRFAQVTIPVVGISAEQGGTLVTLGDGHEITLEKRSQYTYMDGTSMAAPHVVGVIAKIWRHCRGCSSEEVSDCVQSSAVDLGMPGWDSWSGYGLVQTKASFECLVQTGCCEANDTFMASLHSGRPSASPSSVASEAPSDVPSMMPSDYPSTLPSMSPVHT